MHNQDAPTQSFQDGRLLTPDEAAAYLQISVHTLAMWRSTERYKLPYYRIGNLIRYKAKDLKAFPSSAAFSHDDSKQ